MAELTLQEGTCYGAFLILRDVEGRRHAVGRRSVIAACEADATTLLMLPGGKLIHVEHDLERILSWLTWIPDAEAKPYPTSQTDRQGDA